MDRNTQKLLSEFNTAIIQLRGIYSVWSKQQGLSYNEMLVLYTIRDCGVCTQKQLSDSYLLPRQTIHHVITTMRKQGLLELEEGCRFGREKAFVLTKKGQEYAAPFLASLNEVEEKAANQFGLERLQKMAQFVMEYGCILEDVTGALN